MNSLQIIFYLFSGLAVISATLMVITKNLFRAAFLLLVCLVSIAGLYVVLNAYLLAVVQLLIYAGGIVVLLSFGIMLSNRNKIGEIKSDFHLVFPGLLGSAGFVFLVLPLLVTKDVTWTNEVSDVNLFGKAFMTEYILMFEVIGFLLLVVLVGASLFANTSSKSE